MCEEAFQDFSKKFVSLEGAWRFLTKKKWGGNKRNSLYSEL